MNPTATWFRHCHSPRDSIVPAEVGLEAGDVAIDGLDVGIDPAHTLQQGQSPVWFTVPE
ncbi:hypothetical protein ACFWP5_15455 [Streptomyces sp. NPDC058469]|uniref:hypothetical protein n=1 Tax=Streptomyces sp. NPDC058469 TaxID=3346514 RepID=UPI00364D225C